jgi:hypothetical protein
MNSQLITITIKISIEPSNKVKDFFASCVVIICSLIDIELDDSAYNRMWSMRGFRQAYHFWKENKRASSPALHSFITYITLPWHHIIADLFSNRQQSILTF